MTLVHYTELMDDKNIVLMAGAYDKNMLNIQVHNWFYKERDWDPTIKVELIRMRSISHIVVYNFPIQQKLTRLHCPVAISAVLPS